MKPKRTVNLGIGLSIATMVGLSLLLYGCGLTNQIQMPEAVENPEMEQKIEQGMVLLATVQSDPCLEDIVNGVPEESWRCGTPSPDNAARSPEATPTNPIPADTPYNPPQIATVDWNEANAYVGEFKSVCGRVVDSYFAHASNGQPTFLNIGKEYPDPERFTVLIWGEQLENFPFDPDEYYLGRKVCVRGLIKEYNGTLEIIADRPNQIELVDE